VISEFLTTEFKPHRLSHANWPSMTKELSGDTLWSVWQSFIFRALQFTGKCSSHSTGASAALLQILVQVRVKMWKLRPLLPAE